MKARTVGRLLFTVAGAVAALGLVAELLYFRRGLSADWANFFSLSSEGNLPTWYASLLLAACGVAALFVASQAEAQGAGYVAHWRGLGALFLFFSLDEAVEIHEDLGMLFEGEGMLHFGWVVPAAIIVSAIGLVYLPFLLHLERRMRLEVLLAGGIYVGGALLMELPLGAYADVHGTDNLGYGLIDWVEESLELIGATLYLLALLRFFERKAPSVGGRR